MTDLVVDHERYRVRPPFTLESIDPADTQGLTDAKAARKQLKRNRKQIADLQERLFAERKHAALLVLQAMDAGGKDSTIEAVTRGVNPQGCVVTGYKAPSKEELEHDFLWRVHDHAPRKGRIAVFNRSHYEDVLVVRVNGWAPADLIEKRYGHINDFERLLTDHGTSVAKVMLHVSPEYQLEQFRERLADPSKQWKFNPGDLDARAQWGDFMSAFEIALNRCSTENAPWYVVPSEHKWFRTLVVSQILLKMLQDLDPQYPEPDYDTSAYTPESLS